MTDDRDDTRPDEPTDEHADLRALLAANDPASSLSPADPAWVARLLEDTMTDEQIDESRTDGVRNRSRLTWLVAAAAVVLIAAGAWFVTVGDDDDNAPVAGDDPTSEPTSQSSSQSGSPDAPSVTQLEAVPAPARCMAPEAAPQVLAGQNLAFDGVVTSISGDKVTLEPTQFYTGEETDLVTVTAPGGGLTDLLDAVRFEEGGRYLVSATDGQVTLCGFSSEYTDKLAGLYADAFGD
ncbi:hypothetical protein [Nocardioides sp. GXZ039]|uniref:hypothetical protein n=1 Tax=Nocardioides sp. GXZ039 TaxID=3136018 RepID=UPI0030F4A755